MRIGFFSTLNPEDPWEWSGTMNRMYRALRSSGADVESLGRQYHARRTRRAKWRRKLYRLPGLGRVASLLPQPEHDELLRCARSDLMDFKPDVIFAPLAGKPALRLESEVPVVHLSDATVPLLYGYYYEDVKRDEEKRRKAAEDERQLFQQLDLLIFSSQWAADSAINECGAEPARVRVVPFGANIENPPPLEDMLACRSREQCQLLFLAKGLETRWKRKGGDIAVEAVLEANRLGTPAKLIIIGDAPPEFIGDNPHVRLVGVLNKGVHSERQRFEELMRTSHFMFVPSRADCTPIVFCEANAYGLPIISTRTGGIPSIVEHGHNGYLLDEGAAGKEFGALIHQLWEGPEHYADMARAARKAYDETFNWPVWGRTVRELLEGLCREQ